MNTQIQTFLFNALLTIITTGFPIVITYLVKLIIQHTNAKQLNTANIIAKNAVLFTKQITSDLKIDNSVKLNSALNSASQLGKKYGINLEDSQWRSLLEASLLEIKKGLNEFKDASNIITPSTELLSLEGQNLTNNEVVESAESVGAVGVEGDSNESEKSTVSHVVVSEDMMKEINNAVLAKATSDATKAINIVIESVQKSISDSEEKQ